MRRQPCRAVNPADGEQELWGMILAGGEGERLRPLTTVVAGDERPKQFCKLLGDETLLDRTRRRAAWLVNPERTLLVLTRTHERFYAPLVRGMHPACVLVQPANRGTAPAILCGLLRISTGAPMATVAVIPSDHYVSDDATFMSHVAAAWSAVRSRADLVVLLGVAPEDAEVDYGWIEPGEALPLAGLRRIRRFWEKPTPALAELLLGRRCLWNSFVMVARVPTLVAMIRLALPELREAFASAHARFDGAGERRAIAALYDRLTPVGFSEQVLARRPANLVVLPVTGVEWSDWGQPRRVLATLGRLGIRPAWAANVA